MSPQAGRAWHPLLLCAHQRSLLCHERGQWGGGEGGVGLWRGGEGGTTNVGRKHIGVCGEKLGCQLKVDQGDETP